MRRTKKHGKTPQKKESLARRTCWGKKKRKAPKRVKKKRDTPPARGRERSVNLSLKKTDEKKALFCKGELRMPYSWGGARGFPIRLQARQGGGGIASQTKHLFRELEGEDKGGDQKKKIADRFRNTEGKPPGCPSQPAETKPPFKNPRVVNQGKSKKGGVLRHRGAINMQKKQGGNSPRRHKKIQKNKSRGLREFASLLKYRERNDDEKNATGKPGLLQKSRGEKACREREKLTPR